MSKNKIIYLIDTLQTGGAEISLLEIASRLQNWEPVVIAIYKGETLKPKFEKTGIKTYSLNIRKKFGLRKGYKQICSIVKHENPLILHAFLFRAEQFSRLIGPRFNIPVINSFVNDSYSPERYALLSKKKKISLNFYKTIDRITAGKVTQFISLTNAIILNNTKALKIDPLHINVINRGRDFQQLRNQIDPYKISQIKNEFGDGPIILTVSRLLIRKGYIEAIKAIRQLISAFPDIKYLIAGEGHDRLKIENLIKDLDLENNVFLLGNRKDVPSLLEASDIFLFPSHFEGQGGAMIEAMMLGKPIIASKIKVIEETVQDKFSALLYEAKNINDMADKISWALTNKEKMQEIARNAKTEGEEKYNIDRILLQYENMYNKIIEA